MMTILGRARRHDDVDNDGDDDEDGGGGGDEDDDDGKADDAADDVNADDDHDAHVLVMTVVVMMMARLMRKSARAEVQAICQTVHARASTHAWCPRVLFAVCTGVVPWPHDRASRVHRAMR